MKVHPGEILREEFLKPMGIAPGRLAREVGLSRPSINDLVRERKRLTPQLAALLGRYFGNGPKFWLGLQMDFDLRTLMADEELTKTLMAITPHQTAPKEPPKGVNEPTQLEDRLFERILQRVRAELASETPTELASEAPRQLSLEPKHVQKPAARPEQAERPPRAPEEQEQGWTDRETKQAHTLLDNLRILKKWCAKPGPPIRRLAWAHCPKELLAHQKVAQRALKAYRQQLKDGDRKPLTKHCDECAVAHKAVAKVLGISASNQPY